MLGSPWGHTEKSTVWIIVSFVVLIYFASFAVRSSSALMALAVPLDSISWIPESGKYLVECTAEDLAYRNRKGGYTDPFHDWIRRASECLANGHLPNLTE